MSFDDIDKVTDNFVANPHRYYAALLEKGACFWDDEVKCWRVPGYHAAVSLLQDKTLSSALTLEKKVYPRKATPEMLAVQAFSHQSLLYMDAPQHTAFRKVLTPYFTQSIVSAFAPALKQYLDSILVEKLVAFDYVEDVSMLLPGMMMLAFLGFPVDAAEQFVLDALRAGQFVEALFCPPTTFMPVYEIMQRHQSYINDAMSSMNAAMPAKRMASDLIDAGLATQSTVWQIFSILIMTGIETSVASLSGSLYTVLNQPQLYQQLCDDPAVIPTAVDELIRFEPPAHLTIRIAKQDIVYGGETIKAGDLLRIYLAAANRDPSQFPNPNTVDLARQPNQHLSFGMGSHYCLGRLLGRLSSQINLDVMTTRFPKLHLAEPNVQWHMGRYFRHLTSLILQP